MVLDEAAEGPAIVAVPVVAQHAAALDEAIDVDLVLSGLEQVSHLGNPIDEGEAAHAAELLVQRVHEGERELSELRDRAADVTQQHELRPVRVPPAHDHVERDAAGLQRTPNGATRVEAAGAAQPAMAPDPGC